MTIAIYGCGFVGLVSGACFSELGHDVICLDLNPDRVHAINQGRAPFFEPDLDSILLDMRAAGRLAASSDLDRASDADIIFIAVGTPTYEGRIDLGQIVSAAQSIGEQIAAKDGFPVVIVKSTVVPGTTAGIVRQTLEVTSGKIAGRDFGLCMNPEFLREGSAVADFRDPDRIVIGASDERTAAIVDQLYAPYSCEKFHTTPTNAEMSKYASNCLLATMISYSNEFARLCESFETCNVELVIDTLAADRRLSPRVDGRTISPGILSYLRPGIGYGGSCLPKDVSALRHLARSIGAPAMLLDAVHYINETRAGAIVSVTELASGDLNNRKIAILGLAFKPGTDDTRESPALKVIDELMNRGARIAVYDPLVATIEGDKRHNVAIAASASDALAGADAAIIATAWPEFAEIDWAHEVTRMAQPIVVDGRNLLFARARPAEMVYLPVGRRETATR